MFTFTSASEADSQRIGAELAEVLPAGTVVALIGTLGAGKTRLVQAVAAGLGVSPDSVTSPTFILVNEYRGGRLPIYHFDTYRLKDEDEFLDLGPDEYFDSDGIVFIEWADRVSNLLPKERIEISIEVTGETGRQIRIDGTSPRMNKVVSRLQSACRSAPSSRPRGGLA